MKVEYFDLRGKRALVSGGASGIGASIVEHLCEQGVEVYFFDINTVSYTHLTLPTILLV